MTRPPVTTSVERWSTAAVLAGAILLAGCVVAAPAGQVRVVTPPVAIGVELVQPSWEYYQVGGVWYYGPHGRGHRHHHGHYVLRGGVWVLVR